MDEDSSGSCCSAEHWLQHCLQAAGAVHKQQEQVQMPPHGTGVVEAAGAAAAVQGIG